MPATYTLIASNTLSSSAASVTFSAIPGTYTDLVLRISGRADNAQNANTPKLEINATTINYSHTYLNGNGASASSYRESNAANIYFYLNADAANATSNTFGSLEIYIPSYTVSQNKPLSGFGAQENNNATAFVSATAGLWRNTAAITELKVSLTSGDNYVSGSSFFLYGIKNS